MNQVNGVPVYDTLAELVEPEHTALLIVDVQNDFCHPDGHFAKHGKDLSSVLETLPRVRNLTMAVREGKDGILFLHKVKRGVSNRSYGIHVAKLAGVPGAVIRRAGEILKRLESRSPRLKPGTGPETDSSARPGDHAQLRLRMEEEREEPLRKALLEVEPEGITPIEAIQILAELREKAEE